MDDYMDIKDYSPQIKVLIPLRNEPDFSELLNNILFGETNSDKFLIKMELNRLTQPCVRVIDFRDKVSDKISHFTHQQLTHYLPTYAITAFQEAIGLYGDYTVGAYESLFAYIQKIKQQKIIQTNVKKTPNNSPNITESIQLNNHNKRAAARMFFVSPVIITLENGNKYDASTANISESGLKIKLTDNIHCLNDENVQIAFVGLSKEYLNTAINGKNISYRVIKQKQENNAHYFYLSIAPNNLKFIDFTKMFIRTNQYKYKIDVYYYFQLARENALKKSCLMAMNTLPIYLDENSPFPILFILKNTRNKEISADWQSNNANQFPSLFGELRLTKLLKFAKTKATTTLYSFSHTSNGVEYMLSATEEELSCQNLKHLFIEYGQTKQNWRRYHLTLQAYTYKANKKYELTALQPSSFNKITHIATLTQLSSDELVERNTSQEKPNLNLLNQFVHREKESQLPLIYDLFPDELRKEARYGYHSPITLEENEFRYSGNILDFSYSGLKIKLDKNIILVKRSLIKIDFTDLQKLSKKFPLVNLEYRVIESSGNNTYHLQVASRESFIAVYQFFSLLVKNNPTHFKIIPLKSRQQPVASRLHEVAEASLNNALFFITSGNGKPKLSYSSIAPMALSLQQLFGFGCHTYKEHNHIAISNNQLLDRLLFIPLRQAVNDELQFEKMIYVKKMKGFDNKLSVSSYLDEDFSSLDSKRQFIAEHKQRGELQILHYRLSLIKTPDLSAIKSEIRIISRFAIHLTKRIEEELLAVNAMIEIIDRTEHILSSNNY